MGSPAPAAAGVGRVRLATPADDDAIHRLNYRTFVEEIPQHPPNTERRLVDRFHDQNVYAVYEVDGTVVGMVSARMHRPFSLDQQLGPVEEWLAPNARPLEIRLLAIEPAFRATRVFVRLVLFLTAYCMAAGYDVAVISGTTRQLQLYRHLGFIPFGRQVGHDGAWYQPMYITRERVAQWSAAMTVGGGFLTGPVEPLPTVQAALARLPIPHRSAAFRRCYEEVQARLGALTGARHVTLLQGSGTLANDVVGVQLAQLDAPGVVVSNGEFGERLIDHAERLGLTYRAVRVAWGEELDVHAIDAAMTSTHAQWLWAVHTETSTGVMNDLSVLRTLADRHGVRLALDTVSSVGVVPVSLDGVWMATAVSGKGLAAFPGVAIVLHNDPPLAASRAALTRGELSPLAPPPFASPAVHTIPLPATSCSRTAGEQLRAHGWHVGFESAYLLQRNRLQLCLFGEYSPAALEALPRALATAARGATAESSSADSPFG
jgi:GNAT superfamily N-acetyltransferase